jgi:hypothetical protein
MRLPVEVAEGQAAAGSFGPFLFVQGRVAVLRQDFLAYLARRASRGARRDKEIVAPATAHAAHGGAA